MSQTVPLIVLAVLFIGVVTYSRRTKQRAAAADSARREHLRPGAEVMTTSGLYGTVAAVNDDDTVLLSIAAGVEVRWSVAALREVSELPDRYRGPIADPARSQTPGEGGPEAGNQDPR